MNSSRPSAFRKFCAAVAGRIAGVAAAWRVYAAPITQRLAEVPLQGMNPSSRTSCSRSTTRAAWGGTIFRTGRSGSQSAASLHPTVATAGNAAEQRDSTSVRCHCRALRTVSGRSIRRCAAAISTRSTTTPRPPTPRARSGRHAASLRGQQHRLHGTVDRRLHERVRGLPGRQHEQRRSISRRRRRPVA